MLSQLWQRHTGIWCINVNYISFCLFFFLNIEPPFVEKKHRAFSELILLFKMSTVSHSMIVALPFSAPNTNAPCWMWKLDTFSQHLTISDGTWMQHPQVQLSGWRKWGNLLNSVPLDRHKHRGCHRWAGSVSVGVHLASTKIPLLLFHYKIPPFGEVERGTHAKLNIKRLISKTWNCRHSAVMKWNVFHSRPSPFLADFIPHVFCSLHKLSFNINLTGQKQRPLN